MNQDGDQWFQELADLPGIEPGPEWQTRVRARCHAELARRDSRRKRAARRSSIRIRLLEAVTVAFLFAYLSAVVQSAFRF